METPADVNNTTRAMPPVYLQRFAGDKLYDMKEVHIGYGLLDLTNLMS